MPIIYTPGVAMDVSISVTFIEDLGDYLSLSFHRLHRQMLANPRFSETEVIVVSDGERILGLGESRGR